MTRLKITAFAVALLFAAAALADGEPAPRLLHTKVIPTPHELANPDLYYQPVSERYVPPAPYFGPPPGEPIVRPGEFDPLDSTIISITGPSGAYADMWVKMVQGFTQSGHLWIAISEADKETFQPLLDAADPAVDASTYSYLHYPLNSIWVRDYGPEFAVGDSDERYIFDANYSSRPLDDVVPILMGAGDWLNSDGSPMVVNTVIHGLSGGNIMSDGAGTCFFSNIVYGYEKPNGWDNADVDQLMLDYLGCEQVVTLKPICLDMTGHIDLYAKFMGATSILLAEFPVDTHFDGATDSGVSGGFCGSTTPDDRGDQEDNLATIMATTNLSGDPWTITRAPAPEPFLQSGEWVYRAYMNSEIMNGVLLMPSFYEPKNDETIDFLLNQEADAIAAYEAAYTGPGSLTVIPIDVDHMNGTGGAIHCISHDIPEEPGGAWTAPATYCGDGVVNGTEECEGDDFAGLNCQDFGGYDVDMLICNADCTIDSSECAQVDCGNGVLDDGEECDPCMETQDLCSDYGMGAGNVGCDMYCNINYFNCQEATLCEAWAAADPNVICCPGSIPSTCDDPSWTWPAENPGYGCCTADLTETYSCDSSTGSVKNTNCGSAHCGYVEDQDKMYCNHDDIPEASAPDIDCDTDVDSDTDTDTDADSDADSDGGGSGDDGCSCNAAGHTVSSLLSLLASLF